MSILKQQVSSSSIFVSFFIVMIYIFSVNIKLIHFLLWTKGSHQSSNFYTFECSGENLPNSSCHFPNASQLFFKFCITLQCHERKLLCTFLAQTIYTLLKRSTLKLKFLRLPSALVKIRRTLHVNFEMASQFLLKFCIIFHCHDT